MDSFQNNDKAHGSAYELPMRLYLVDSYTLVPWSPLQKKKRNAGFGEGRQAHSASQ